MSSTNTEREIKYCHFLVNCSDIGEPPQSSDLTNAFMKGTLEEKKDNLKLLMKMIISDDNYPRLIMPVLTNLQQLQDHGLKRLLFLYWEIIEKTNFDGTLKEELILACNALRKDLLSPNEYIRGRTLRLVSKITIKSILENLMEAVSQNLAHRHQYVRRNAIMCLYNIYMTTGMELLEDFVDEIDRICQTESDLSTKRNAFLLLFHVDQNRALVYLKQLIANADNDDEPIYEQGDIFQLVVLDMLRRLCKVEPTQKSRLMNAIFMLSNSKSPSVLLECANTIVQLTTAPTAIKVAVQSYLQLLQDQNDNNVKLVVLNKIVELKQKYSKILEEYMPDILSIIREDSVQSIEINQRVLELVTDLVNMRNVPEVGEFLRKEIVKARKLADAAKDAASKDSSASGTAAQGGVSSTNEYRYLLIKSVNKITQLYPATIPSMIEPLMDSFLVFEKRGSMASLETIMFIREIIEVYPEHKTSILTKLNSLLGSIKNHLVLKVTIWVLGEYSSSSQEVTDAFESIRANIGSLPLQVEEPEEEKKTAETEGDSNQPKVITKTIILPDGSYGTETIVVDPSSAKNEGSNPDDDLPLRKVLKSAEDDFLASCVSITITKLAVKQKKNLQIKKFNSMAVEAALVICAMLKLQKKNQDPNNNQRMQVCLKILTSPASMLKSVNGVLKILSDMGKKIFKKSLEGNSRLFKDDRADEKQKLIVTQPDEQIVFRQLKGRAAITEFDVTEEISDTLGSDAIGYESFLGEIKKDMDAKVYQLTGFSDDIYAEAFVEVHHYDILLRIVLINRTKKTLPNINFEFLTQGNLKLIDKPIPITLKPESTSTLKASLKVSSTDNGVIYGYITYDQSSSGNEPRMLNINEIQIDFINDLMQANCTELDFKKKWAEYEWENKVQVNTTMTDLIEYVDHFAKSLNVSLMSKLDELEQTEVSRSSFLVANFYTKSKFDEDCLLNMSIEKVNYSAAAAQEGSTAKQEVKIQGLIRLRAKTEGMALCVGEKCKLVR